MVLDFSGFVDIASFFCLISNTGLAASRLQPTGKQGTFKIALKGRFNSFVATHYLLVLERQAMHLSIALEVTAHVDREDEVHSAP